MKPDRKKTRISLIEDISDYIRDITPSERAMLVTLARFANPDGTNVFPGQKLLMEIIGRKEREVRNLLTSLEKKGYLVPDGHHGYRKKYRLNIPSAPIIGQVAVPAAPGTDISQEEWESKFLTDEELQARGLQRPGQSPPPEEEDLGGPLEDELEETQPRLPAVKPPAAARMALVPVTPITRLPATYQPPGPTPEEKLQRDMEVLKETLDLVARGICTYDQFMRGGRRKGFSDDFLNWMFTGGGETGSSNGSQPYNEPDLITNLVERSHQPLNDHIVT